VEKEPTCFFDPPNKTVLSAHEAGTNRLSKKYLLVAALTLGITYMLQHELSIYDADYIKRYPTGPYSGRDSVCRERIQR
jgi:hypothetical protein